MNIYIIFSATPYRIGKFIRRFTGETYNHVSIALDEDLKQMYGFARRFYRTPFYGGFVRESLSRYHVGGNTADIRICQIPVTTQQHQMLSDYLSQMFDNREQYPYNHLSAALTPFRRPVAVQNAYTCVEFCVRILHDIGMDLAPGKYYTIGQLEQLLHPYTVYTGPAPEATEYDTEYYHRKPVPHPISATASAFFTLFKRLYTK